jgi:hypothetical protein
LFHFRLPISSISRFSESAFAQSADSPRDIANFTTLCPHQQPHSSDTFDRPSTTFPSFFTKLQNNRLVASFPLKMRNTGSWAAAVDDDDDDDDWEKGARSLFTCPRYTVDD